MQINLSRMRAHADKPLTTLYELNIVAVLNEEERRDVVLYGIAPLLIALDSLHPEGAYAAYEALISPTGLTISRNDPLLMRQIETKLMNALQQLCGEFWPAARAFERSNTVIIAPSGVLI